MLDDRLALSVKQADGAVVRWGPGELDAADIPTRLRFGTTVPGGYKTLSCDLLRRIDLDHPDENLFDNVRVYGPGNETAWDGRAVGFPASHGDHFTVSPDAVGWSAHLGDDTSFSMVYVDRDLSQWGPMSVQRRVNVSGSGSPGDPQTHPDVTTGYPSLALEYQGRWSATYPVDVEAWYDAGSGNLIGSIYYAWKRGPNLSGTDVNWNWQVNATTDDVSSSFDSSGNLRAAGPGTGTLTTTGLNKRFGQLALIYGGLANTTDGILFGLYFTCLAVYGDHGLPKFGAASDTSAAGLRTSDVVAHIVASAAPLLTFSTGTSGSIRDVGTVIPHLTFKTPGKAEDAITQANKFNLYPWGVYAGATGPREFFWKPWDPDELTWEVRLADGVWFDPAGASAEDSYNGVVVTYKLPDGAARAAGPPGSGFDVTDTTLVDTSPQNPVNAHGIPRRWALLDISDVTTDQGAKTIGAIYLRERSQAPRRGTIRVTTGQAIHPTAGSRPAWAIKAGDHVAITDHPVSEPRRIIETDYDHDTRTNTLTVDNSSQRLDALLERMGVALVGVV